MAAFYGLRTPNHAKIFQCDYSVGIALTIDLAKNASFKTYE